MRSFSLPLLHCHRCIYSWRPAKPIVRMCPRCKSKLWDVPKVRRPPFHGTGLGVADVVTPHQKEILGAVRRHRALAPRVFGSVARGEAGPDSDLDVLVRFRKSASLFDVAELRREIAGIIGRDVDIVSESSLRWYVAPQALAEAVSI